ncbi:MAG: NAD-dependent epimerase/dehydratase family protein [Spirochaetales bacterium]|nr:NAD-dependent epimerase/dehydratase family protein [Spirochaetales bacterium]
MAKAFVTGAAGFLGVNLVKELLAQDWEVIAFHLTSDNLKNLSGMDIQYEEGNILDYESLLRMVFGHA